MTVNDPEIASVGQLVQRLRSAAGNPAGISQTELSALLETAAAELEAFDQLRQAQILMPPVGGSAALI